VTGFDRALSKFQAALTVYVGVLLELWLVTEKLYFMKYFPRFPHSYLIPSRGK